MANLNLNKVILGGRLTSDIELKQTANGIAVTAFTVAVNRSGRDQPTDFIDCVAWRKTAEFIAQYFRKGSTICIIGNIQKRQWTDNNGAKRYATEVIVDEAKFVDSKSDTEYAAPQAIPAAAAPQYEELGANDDFPF